MDEMGSFWCLSAAISLHSALHSLTDHAAEDCIMTTIAAEGDKAAYARADEEGETPDPGDSSRGTDGDIACLALTVRT